MSPFRDMLARGPVNEQKWRVLRVLDEVGPQDQNTVANLTCLLLSSLSRQLVSMENDGYITRRNDTADRRRSIVEITEKGRGVLKLHAAETAAIFAEQTERFGAEKLDQLLEMLEDLQRSP